MKIQEKQNFNNHQEDGCNVLGPLPHQVSIKVLNEIFNQKFGYYFPCQDGRAWVVARKIKPQKGCKGGFSL